MSNQTITQALTAIATAIRGKTGGSDTYKPGEMAAAITEIPTENAALKSVLDGTATGDVEITGLQGYDKLFLPIRQYTQITGLSLPDFTGELVLFVASSYPSSSSGYTNLQSLSIPNATKLFVIFGSGNLFLFTDLATLSAPKVTDLAGNLNMINLDLTTLSLPELTTYPAQSTGMFSSSAFTSASLPKVTEVRENSFKNCAAMTTVDVQAATKINTSAFEGCTALTTVDASACERVYGSAFKGCTSLEEIELPACKEFNSVASIFEGCSALETCDIGADTTPLDKIAQSVFKNCTNLTALILRGDVDSGETYTVTTLSATNAFTGSAIAGGTGYIYVPSAHVSEYQQASNWSTYSAQIRAIEDYTVDGTLTGALDPTKI